MEKCFFALGGNANEAEEDDDHNSLAGRVELHMMLPAAQSTRPMFPIGDVHNLPAERCSHCAVVGANLE